MRSIVSSVFATALLVATPPVQASPEIDAVVRRADKEVADGTVPSVALAVARNGVIVYEHAFGDADRDSHVRANPHTAYSLASTSKPITATALLALAERGRVDLDAPVANYIAPLRFPSTDDESAGITLRQLLSHTSGLPTYARIRYGADAAAASFEEAFRRYGVVVHPPGRVMEYSNLGYGLVGYVISRRSGVDFGTFVEQSVFRPLGMRDSYVDSPGTRPIATARRYGSASDVLPELANDTPGAGNVYASVHDLIRFAMFHLAHEGADRSPLSRRSVEAMQANSTPDSLQHYYGQSYYGLGWYVQPGKPGDRVVWHEGGMPGASSLLLLIPEQRIAVAVLINRTDANDLAQSLAAGLVHAVAPGVQLPSFDPTENYVPYQSQAAFVGAWRGSAEVDGTKVPVEMDFRKDGQVKVRVGATGTAPFAEATVGGRVYRQSFVSALPGRLPAQDLGRADPSVLLLKLIAADDRLSGTLVAYDAPQRLNYLLPFRVRLRRVDAAAGIAECDSYLDAYQSGLARRLGRPFADLVRQGFDARRSAWRSEAADPARRHALAALCKDAARLVQESNTSVSGVAF